MYEMRKRKQIHERCQADVMNQHSCRKDWESGEVAIWEVMTWSEEWTGRRIFDMVQKVFEICEAKNGTKTNELLQT